MTLWPFSEPLRVGSAAPDFSLPDETGRVVTLSGLRGREVVLVFYPGDDTPTCTRQLCEFRDAWQEARERGIEVLGVNPWSASKHEKFRRKFNFPFPLLVDAGQKVASQYNAGGLWVKRTVYRIGKDGTIRFASRGVPKPEVVFGTE
jgi:thioredoxin-dependent peroxiredoxin